MMKEYKPGEALIELLKAAPPGIKEMRNHLLSMRYEEIRRATNIYEKIAYYNQLKKEIEEELQASFDEVELVEEYTDEMHCEIDGRYYYDTSKCEEHAQTVLCIKIEHD